MTSPWDDPGAQQWLTHVRKTLIPMLDQSAITISLGPDLGNTDIKFAVELGLSILMDKPILVVALPGRTVPDKLRMIADDVVHCDPHTKAGQAELMEAIMAMQERLAD